MEESNKELFFHKETDWESIGEGLSRQITGYDKNIMMVKVKFEKGSIGELHHHVYSQVSYVASGEFELTLENNT